MSVVRIVKIKSVKSQTGENGKDYRSNIEEVVEKSLRRAMSRHDIYSVVARYRESNGQNSKEQRRDSGAKPSRASDLKMRTIVSKREKISCGMSVRVIVVTNIRTVSKVVYVFLLSVRTIGDRGLQMIPSKHDVAIVGRGIALIQF